MIENDIISACMVSSENVIAATESGVTGAWFDTPVNTGLFDSLSELSGEKNWNIRDSILVLQQAKVFEKHAGSLDLCENTPEWALSAEDFTSALDVLKSNHASRTVQRMASDALSGINAGKDPFEVIDSATFALNGMQEVMDDQHRTTEEIAKTAFELDSMVAKGQPLGLPFPWTSFQLRTFGIPPRAVTMLAGRDGKGKSRLSMFLTEYWGRMDIPGLYMPFEDGAERMISNTASTYGKYDMFTIKKHNVPDGFLDHHQASLERVSKMPIYISDRATVVERIVSTIAYHKRKFGIQYVVIDGFKDIILSKGENQTTKENHIMSALTRASKQYDVSIMPVVHLNKLEDGEWIYKNKITGSGKQSQSARMVLVYQDAGFTEDLTGKFDMEGCIVLQCQKASYGDKGSIVLRPELETGQFTQMFEEGQ